MRTTRIGLTLVLGTAVVMAAAAQSAGRVVKLDPALDALVSETAAIEKVAGGVWIISPAGKALGRIEAPEVPANVAWGEDGKTLFLTARTSVYRVRVNASGKLP